MKSLEQNVIKDVVLKGVRVPTAGRSYEKALAAAVAALFIAAGSILWQKLKSK